MNLDRVKQVADALIYEGYVLYPYRASAAKNRARFQFGVLFPPSYVESDRSERSRCRVECVVEGGPETGLTLSVRFLHLQVRTVEEAVAGGGYRPVDRLEVDGHEYRPWDEAVDTHEKVVFSLHDLPITHAFEREEWADTGPVGRRGRIVRRRYPLKGELRVEAEPLPGPWGAHRLSVTVDNHTPLAVSPAGDRTEALRRSMVACHLLMGVEHGWFVSMLDPPEWAAPFVESCRHEGLFPVLAGPIGDRSLLLASPIILYDHPQVAAESPGDMFDATEIDEILTLRTLALTEAEKQEVRATDRRAAEILDRIETMPPEMWDRLHGAIRSLEPVSPPEPTPWWDPGADDTVSPETDRVTVDGREVGKGSRVLLRPGRHRADAQDMFLRGRTATVEAVFFDVDGNSHLAVTLDDDAAADLHQAHGRYLYFSPDEVEPLGVAR